MFGWFFIVVHGRQIWNQQSHIFSISYITQFTYKRMFHKTTSIWESLIWNSQRACEFFPCKLSRLNGSSDRNGRLWSSSQAIEWPAGVRRGPVCMILALQAATRASRDACIEQIDLGTKVHFATYCWYWRFVKPSRSIWRHTCQINGIIKSMVQIIQQQYVGFSLQWWTIHFSRYLGSENQIIGLQKFITVQIERNRHRRLA